MCLFGVAKLEKQIEDLSLELNKAHQEIEDRKTLFSQMLPHDDTDVTRKYECKVCMNRLIGVVFMPCGHAMSCLECANRVKKCPVCKRSINEISRIYMM